MDKDHVWTPEVLRSIKADLDEAISGRGAIKKRVLVRASLALNAVLSMVEEHNQARAEMRRLMQERMEAEMDLRDALEENDRLRAVVRDVARGFTLINGALASIPSNMGQEPEGPEPEGPQTEGDDPDFRDVE